jgi:hypothetical protein
MGILVPDENIVEAYEACKVVILNDFAAGIVEEVFTFSFVD